MATAKPELSKANLVKLFEAKKMKDARLYIEQIAKQNAKAEAAVIEALNHCLVLKKTTPIGMMTALYFYKDLVIKAEFDFLESQAFIDKIHHAVYQVCFYKASLEDPTERGKTYFSETLKSEEDTEVYGKTFVILALETIQSLAEWYPVDYFTEEKSRYLQYYEELKKKKVTFPKMEENSYLLPQERKKFEANFSAWKRGMDGFEEKIQQEEAKKGASQIKGSADPTKGNQKQGKETEIPPSLAPLSSTAAKERKQRSPKKEEPRQSNLKEEPRQSGPKKEEPRQSNLKEEPRQSGPKKEEPRQSNLKEEPRQSGPKKEEPRQSNLKEEPRQSGPKKEEPRQSNLKEEPRQSGPKKEEPRQSNLKEEPRQSGPKKEEPRQSNLKEEPRQSGPKKEEPRQSNLKEEPRQSGPKKEEPRQSNLKEEPRQSGPKKEEPRQSNLKEEPRQSGPKKEEPRQSNLKEEPRQSGPKKEEPRQSNLKEEPRQSGPKKEEPRQSNLKEEANESKNMKENPQHSQMKEEPKRSQMKEDSTKHQIKEEPKQGNRIEEPRQSHKTEYPSRVPPVKESMDSEELQQHSPSQETKLSSPFSHEQGKKTALAEEMKLKRLEMEHAKSQKQTQPKDTSASMRIQDPGFILPNKADQGNQQSSTALNVVAASQHAEKGDTSKKQDATETQAKLGPPIISKLQRTEQGSKSQGLQWSPQPDKPRQRTISPADMKEAEQNRHSVDQHSQKPKRTLPHFEKPKIFSDSPVKTRDNRRMAKMERPADQKPNKLADSPCHSSPPKRSKRKSIRKTELRQKLVEPENGIFERISAMTYNSIHPNYQNSVHQGLEKKTLSHFRHQKIRRGLHSQDYLNNEVEPILAIIERARLDEVVIPFVPQYFAPVEYKMHALMSQSLRVAQISNQPSKSFFHNDTIAARLIKNPEFYILTVHNVSSHSIEVAYSQRLQSKYGDEFSLQAKVHGYESRKPDQTFYWKVHPTDFIDIRFSFKVWDPNFKFLQFCLLINKQVVTLYLPITLLDMGNISKHIDYDDMAGFIEMNGRLMKSEPIILKSLQAVNYQHHQNSLNIAAQLPQFFGLNKVRDSTVLGQMVYSIEIDYSNYVSVVFLLKQLNPTDHCLQAIYDYRQPYNEDYAKVLLQVLCLLLSGKIQS